MPFTLWSLGGSIVGLEDDMLGALCTRSLIGKRVGEKADMLEMRHIATHKKKAFIVVTHYALDCLT